MEDFEEIEPPPEGNAERAAWRRVRAGILVELGLADRVAAKSWQRAVVERRFRPDACADEILARSAVAGDDARVLQRTGVLLRDLLMAPLGRGARGAGRRARQAVRGGLAFVLAQGLALLVFCLIVAALAVVLRLKGHSLDGWVDRLLGRGAG